MARGGKRPGAGRPRGAATRRTREIADRALVEGITPLEVMLRTMRQHWQDGQLDAAAAVAKDCAPYVHPRLASVEVGGQGGGPVQGVIRVVTGIERAPGD